MQETDGIKQSGNERTLKCLILCGHNLFKDLTVN